jgi:hypothetical protein
MGDVAVAGEDMDPGVRDGCDGPGGNLGKCGRALRSGEEQGGDLLSIPAVQKSGLHRLSFVILSMKRRSPTGVLVKGRKVEHSMSGVFVPRRLAVCSAKFVVSDHKRDLHATLTGQVGRIS